MKRLKRILAVVLCVIMTLSAAPLSGFFGFDIGLKAEAADVVSQKLQEVLALFPDGSNFTVNGNCCPKGHGSKCSNCYYPNVVSNRLGWNWSNMYSSYSCFGFTCFVTRYIFGTEWPNNSYVIGTANLSNTTACDNLLSQAKIGDIVSIGTAHRVIFLQKANGGMVVYDSNQGDSYGLCNKVRYGKTNTYSGLKEYYGNVNIELRRMNNYNDLVNYTSPPTWATLSLNSYSHAIGSPIGFSITSDYATGYTIGINKINSDTGTYTRVYTGNTGSYFEYIINEPGVYEAYYTVYNDLGGVDSNHVFFTVGIKPQNVKVTTNKISYSLGEKVYFNAEGQWCDGYCIGVFKVNSDTGEHIRLLTQDINGYLEYSIDSAGVYFAYVTSWNNAGTIDSEPVFFSVGLLPENAVLQIEKDNYSENENIVFTAKADYANGYTLGINKLNETTNKYERVLTQDIDESFDFSVSEKGVYSAYFTAWNDMGGLDSNVVIFYVGYSSVSYNSNGGNNVPSAQTKTYGTDLKLSTTIPTKANYNFIGWNTKADGTGATYQPGDTYTENADVTLYAMWELAHTHSYTSTVTKQPTCTEKGIRKYTCSSCGDTYTEDIAALGHNHIGSVTEPTCTESGFTTYACTRCDNSYNTSFTDPLNHPTSSWHTAVNPTASSDGLAEKRCDHCGKVLEQFIIPSLVPDYVTGVSLSSEKETVKVGNTFTLKATVTPDTAKNKNVIWSSRNPEIATVVNGKVTAVKPGTTAIVATTEDGGYVAFCLVRVLSLSGINGAVINNDSNIVSGLSCNLNSVDTYLELADGNMSIVLSDSVVGTGTIISVTENGEVVDSYTAVIFGDIDGNGLYDANDAFLVNMINAGLISEDELGVAQRTAADCNHDGKIDKTDFELLVQASVLLDEVKQSSDNGDITTSALYIDYCSVISQSAEAEVEPDGDALPGTTVEDAKEEFDFAALLTVIFEYLKRIFSFIVALF